VGFKLRAVTQGIDWIVGMGLALAAGVAAGVVLALLQAAGVVDADWARKVGETTPLSFALGLVGSTLYHALAEGFGGATLGKAMTGLRVRSDDGSPAKLGGALLRSIAFLWDGFFFGMIAYGSMSRSRTQQRNGDKWGHTVVVRAASLPPSAQRPNVAVGVLLGCLAQVVITLLDVTLKVI
jgi:uncharacterized RDD family membrane protein YckC